MAIALFSCRAPTNLTPKPSSVTAKTAVSSLMSPNTARTPAAWMSSARAWKTGTIRLSCMAVLDSPVVLTGLPRQHTLTPDLTSLRPDTPGLRRSIRRHAPPGCCSAPFKFLILASKLWQTAGRRPDDGRDEEGEVQRRWIDLRRPPRIVGREHPGSSGSGRGDPGDGGRCRQRDRTAAVQLLRL